ncbi:MAG: sugar phosphate isomerase/epimerase [Armatimonadetes bacterium]|nr:sugar phosphate isomerase/epimerase [Armatimonadota bacterium]
MTEKQTGASAAVNPALLTGRPDGWPLAELEAMGYGALEIPVAALEPGLSWRAEAERLGLRIAAVNAMDELRPYLTGSLSDNVARRRADAVARLTGALERMAALGIPFLVVAPSRLAEIYQTPEEARALLTDSLLRLSDAAGDAATVLLCGAPFRLFGAAREVAEVVDGVGRANVAAALNLGHALLLGEAPADASRVLGGWLRYVQVNDADARQGLPKLDRHLPLGAGSLDLAEARRALAWALNVTAPDDPLGAARDGLALWTEERR